VNDKQGIVTMTAWNKWAQVQQEPSALNAVTKTKVFESLVYSLLAPVVTGRQSAKAVAKENSSSRTQKERGRRRQIKLSVWGRLSGLKNSEIRGCES